MANEIITDGQLDFSGGVNSLVPPTVASPQAPNGLKRNCLAWLNNATVRGTGITSRAGWQYLTTIHNGTLLHQGSVLYRPVTGDPYLISSIGGHIFKTDLTTFQITDLMPTGITNPPNEPYAYFVQGEEFLVIQAGDNQTLPLFWDGSTLRRSLGPSISFGTTSAPFTVPGIGGIVLVTLTSNYLGSNGQVILINGNNLKQYQIQTNEQVQQLITVKNIFDDNTNVLPGTVIQTLPAYVTHFQSISAHLPGFNVDIFTQSAHTFTIGSGIYVNGVGLSVISQISPTHILCGAPLPGAARTQLFNAPVGSGIAVNQPQTPNGSFLLGFAVPVIGQSATALLSQVYPGPVGGPVLINNKVYEVVSVGAPTIVSNQIYLTNLNDTPGGTVNAGSVLQTVSELPAATTMDYFMGRIWYAQGRTYIAGDIVLGPSGTLPYGFRDSILKVTENPLAIGGDGFTIPAEAGEIRALRHTAELDTSLGEGNLYIFSAKSIYRLKVPVSRTQWIAANDATQPLQTVVQLNYGAVNDRSIVQVNSDLFYQTLEPGIRSLQLSVKYFGQWGNVPISRNEQRVLRFNDRALLRFGASGIEFDNRVLETALPIQTPVGVASQAVVPLDLDLISTLEEKQPPAWEGILEGLDFLQLLEGDFGGRQRAFAIIHSRDDHSIQVWELTDFLRSDFNIKGEARTNWLIEFPALTWDQVFLLKRLAGGEIWVDRVFGTVMFKLEYRPDGDQCWYFWNQWQICSARNSCEDVVNPICYPITPYNESFRQTMMMPEPKAKCESISARPTTIAYQFQTRLTITGWCRVRGIILYAYLFEKSMYQDLYLPGTTPTSALQALNPTVTQVIVSPTLNQQVVPSVAPTTPPPLFDITSTGSDSVVSQTIDPPFNFSVFDFDLSMTIQQQGDGALLTWELPDFNELHLVTTRAFYFQLQRSPTGDGAEVPSVDGDWITLGIWSDIDPSFPPITSSFSDSTKAGPVFYYRLIISQGPGDIDFLYNVVNIVSSQPLDAVQVGTTVHLSWHSSFQ